MAVERGAEESYVFLLVNIEMTGLDKDLEMIQIACKLEGSCTSYSNTFFPINV